MALLGMSLGIGFGSLGEKPFITRIISSLQTCECLHLKKSNLETHDSMIYRGTFAHAARMLL
jgi:hypothetical protein